MNTIAAAALASTAIGGGAVNSGARTSCSERATTSGSRPAPVRESRAHIR